MKSADERITEALKQPIETPDMTDVVMARLPVQRRWRLKWAYAVAIPLLILAVVLIFNRGQKPEYQAAKQPVPVSPAPIVRPVPKPNPPKTIAQEPRPVPRAVRRRHYAPRHVAKSPEPEPVDSRPTPASDDFTALQQSIARAAIEQSKPVVHAPPPIEDAETIERPALEIIANCGPMQGPIEKIGG